MGRQDRWLNGLVNIGLVASFLYSAAMVAAYCVGNDEQRAQLLEAGEKLTSNNAGASWVLLPK